jgi:hypothetical protein
MGIKSGYKTTEFWMTMVGAILPVLFPSLPMNIVLPVLGLVATYVFGRSLVKANQG